METTHAAPQSNPLKTDKIPSLILKYSVPAVISILVNAIYNMVDQIFIGQSQIGMLGIAATNVALPVTTICTGLSILLGSGGASSFNLCLGAGKKEEAGRMAGNALSLLTLSGAAVCGILLLLLSPLLNLFGVTPSVLPYAEAYTAIIAPGVPFLIFSSGTIFLIRADGSPKYAMGCMMAGAVFNLIFDPIFLFVFNMGIQGIALATTLGQMLSFVLALRYLLRRFHTVPLQRKNFKIQADCVKRICAIGSTGCINQLAMMVVQIAMNNALRYYGAFTDYGTDIPLAAVGAITKLNLLFLSFVVGTAHGCQPIFSFNYGARQYARVRSTYKIAFLSVSIIAILSFLCFQIFPGPLMSIFGESDPLYLQFSVRYLRAFMACSFINGIQPLTANFLSSIGHAKRGLLISLTRQILFFLPLILILPLFMGLDGLMYAGPLGDVAAAIVALLLAWQELKNLTQLEKNALSHAPVN